MTPKRLQAVAAALYTAAVKKDDMNAARILLDRVLGRARTEALSPFALDLPDGLETASDVRTAANAILQQVADGSIAPGDAQKAAAVLEAARKSVETEELERRIVELEETMKKDCRRRRCEAVSRPSSAGRGCTTPCRSSPSGTAALAANGLFATADGVELVLVP